jgi:hypothetical protein
MALRPANTEPVPYFALLAKLAREHVWWVSARACPPYERAVTLGGSNVRVGSVFFGAHA